MKSLLLIVLLLLLPAHALAADKVVSLVSLHGLDRENAEYWWETTQSSFSSFDDALHGAFAATEVNLLRPKATDAVSKIYRRSELSDANAATLAGILGSKWVIVGDLMYSKATPLGPGRLPGVTLELRAKLIERKPGGDYRVRDVVELSHTIFESEPGRAAVAAEKELASRISWIVSRHHLTPITADDSVPLAGDWLVLHGVDDGRALDTVLRALRGNAAVSAARVGWTDGRRIAIEIRSKAGELKAADIRSIAAEVARQPESGFSLESLPNRSASLVEFEVQVLSESQ